jgi:hypothetical protein
MRIVIRALIAAVLVFHGSSMKSSHWKSTSSSSFMSRSFTTAETEAINDFKAACELYSQAEKSLENGIEEAPVGKAAQYYYDNSQKVADVHQAAEDAMKKIPKEVFKQDKELAGLKRYIKYPMFNQYFTRASDIDGRE